MVVASSIILARFVPTATSMIMVIRTLDSLVMSTRLSVVIP
jgi:hypothetical protein